MHPILEALVATEHEWIKDLLHAFNSGDIAKFESLVPFLSREVRPLPPSTTALTSDAAHSANLLRFPAPEDLSDGVDRVGVQATNVRPQDPLLHHRARDQAPCRRGRAPRHEGALVRLASRIAQNADARTRLRLLRGTLDQVSSTCQISWVQPRVLDLKQIGGLRERLADWGTSVGAVGAGLKGVTV